IVYTALCLRLLFSRLLAPLYASPDRHLLLPSHPRVLLSIRPPPRPTLFPYTTLFRSGGRRPGPASRRRAYQWRCPAPRWPGTSRDRKSTRLNSSHVSISYAVFCLKKKIPPTQAQDDLGQTQTD